MSAGVISTGIRVGRGPGVWTTGYVLVKWSVGHSTLSRNTEASSAIQPVVGNGFPMLRLKPWKMNELLFIDLQQ